MGEKRVTLPRELVPGQKEIVSSLIAYQKGSVVSRTVLNSKAGAVTTFAFDGGEGLSEHTTPYDALLHVLEGRAEITISGKTSPAERGDAMFFLQEDPTR